MLDKKFVITFKQFKFFKTMICFFKIISQINFTIILRLSHINHLF